MSLNILTISLTSRKSATTWAGQLKLVKLNVIILFESLNKFLHVQQSRNDSYRVSGTQPTLYYIALFYLNKLNSIAKALIGNCCTHLKFICGFWQTRKTQLTHWHIFALKWATLLWYYQHYVHIDGSFRSPDRSTDHRSTIDNRSELIIKFTHVWWVFHTM